MKQFNYVIRDEVGIHARPAGLLTKAAMAVKSAVTVKCNGKSADAKRLIALMAMGVKQGDQVTVEIDGPDEDVAFESLQKFFEENL